MICLLAQTSAFAYIGMVNLLDAHYLMKQPDKFSRHGNRTVVAALPNSPLSEKESAFSTVFASAVGAGTIGSAFGVAGLILGMAVGGAFGLYVNRKHA